ncbi:PTS sugar transporter subunit IIC [Ignatzschineria larvae DSM 13226]|uniref:PTS sugar transporter subunit IIC n=1 Tax=Ignatzschineria larvae DSM 13226 TaxID=1111732 RepID=A0ABZ3BXE8_9GAMM|nr:PTS sugar transporter subunit IIC [Ignatzschineria larvae]
MGKDKSVITSSQNSLKEKGSFAQDIRIYLTKKGISLSPRIYFIQALSYMALGLFSSLLIGLILKTIGDKLGITTLSDIGQFAMDSKIVGGAIGVAIASSLQAPPLILFSALFVGAIGNQLGGPAGAYVAVLLSVEISKLCYQVTKLDIILIPLIMLLVGYGLAHLVGIPVSHLMQRLGQLINWATTQEPFSMSIIVALLMGLALTAPISSAALAFMLGLEGYAAGAAVIGCSAQMIGFATISYRDNSFGAVIAQAIGTSMLQIANIIKNPWILLPPTLAGMIVAPIGILLFEMKNNPAGAGMGTSGFVGQFMAFETMGFSWSVGFAVLLCHIVLPALFAWCIAYLLRKMRRIQDGDLALNYQ